MNLLTSETNITIFESIYSPEFYNQAKVSHKYINMNVMTKLLEITGNFFFSSFITILIDRLARIAECPSSEAGSASGCDLHHKHKAWVTLNLLITLEKSLLLCPTLFCNTAARECAVISWVCKLHMLEKWPLFCFVTTWGERKSVKVRNQLTEQQWAFRGILNKDRAWQWPC